MLSKGDNVLSTLLGNGWFSGGLFTEKKTKSYGETPSLIAQLVIETIDGEKIIIGSDETWVSTTGQVLFSEIYDGEIFDARIESQLSNDNIDILDNTQIYDVDNDIDLIGQTSSCIKCIEKISPIEIITTRVPIDCFAPLTPSTGQGFLRRVTWFIPKI